MIIVLSPAKTLDFESRPVTRVHSQPALLADAAQLIDGLRDLDAGQVGELMDISVALAELNHERFLRWQAPFTSRNAKQAVLAFAGDVYDGLKADELSTAQLKWAQKHLRILSGLYGVLRPLDLIQAYRLEMGTRLPNPRGKDLYAFWGDRVSAQLVEAMQGLRHQVLINLASDEYFRSVDRKALGCPVIQPIFQERRAGGYQVISFSAKRARGMMARFAIDHHIVRPEGLKAFAMDGYRYDPQDSTDREWFFRREAPTATA